MKKIIFILVIIFFNILFSQEQKKHHLKGDKCYYIYKENSDLTCIWSGNVVYEGETGTMYADEIKEYAKGEKIIAEGNVKIVKEEKDDKTVFTGGYLEYIKKDKYTKVLKEPKIITKEAMLTCEIIERFEKEKISKVYNQVKINYKDIKISGNLGVYYEDQKKMEITGNTQLIKENEFTAIGDKIYFFVDKKEITIEGNVKAEIIIKEEKEEKKK